MEADKIGVMDMPLLVADRCDRCGAQAYVRATLENGSVLLFCGHDSAIHLEALMTSCPGIHIFDELERLKAVS